MHVYRVWNKHSIAYTYTHTIGGPLTSSNTVQYSVLCEYQSSNIIVELLSIFMMIAVTWVVSNVHSLSCMGHCSDRICTVWWMVVLRVRYMICGVCIHIHDALHTTFTCKCILEENVLLNQMTAKGIYPLTKNSCTTMLHSSDQVLN